MLVLFALSLTSVGKVIKDDDADARFKAYYLESVCQREKGNRAAQFDLLHRALMIRPNAPEAVFDFADALAYAGTVNDSVVSIFYEKALAFVPDGKDTEGQRLAYMERYSSYLMQVGRLEQAVPYIEKLTEYSVKRERAYRMLMGCYERLGMFEDELRCFNKSLQLYGDDDEILYAKVMTLRRMGRFDEAIAFVDTLLERYPTNLNYSVMKAQAYLQKGDTTNGRRMYEELAKVDQTDPSVQQLMVMYYSQTKQEDKLREALETVVLNERTPTENRVSILKGIMADTNTSDKQQYLESVFNRLMKMPLEDREVVDLYGQYLASRHAPEKAYAPVMHKLLDLEPSDLNARLFLIQEALDSRDYNATVDLCKEGLHYHEKDLRFFLIAGSALNQAKQPKEAKELLERGLSYARNGKNVEQVSNYYASYADVLHAVGEEERSYLYYDSAFVYNPANAVALNNYAYFLSLKEQKLDKAQTMIEKVMRLESDNPTYIDTYAWILFVKKDYEGARTQIDAALKLIKDEPGDGSLYDHAGDIYYHLGLQKEAVEFWKKADELGCDNKVLKTKIKTKKYIANEAQ